MYLAHTGDVGGSCKVGGSSVTRFGVALCGVQHVGHPVTMWGSRAPMGSKYHYSGCLIWLVSGVWYMMLDGATAGYCFTRFRLILIP